MQIFQLMSILALWATLQPLVHEELHPLSEAAGNLAPPQYNTFWLHTFILLSFKKKKNEKKKTTAWWPF